MIDISALRSVMEKGSGVRQGGDWVSDAPAETRVCKGALCAEDGQGLDLVWDPLGPAAAAELHPQSLPRQVSGEFPEEEEEEAEE